MLIKVLSGTIKKYICRITDNGRQIIFLYPHRLLSSDQMECYKNMKGMGSVWNIMM